MRPLKLTLTGFIGIRAGLGRDTITLDLEDLAGDAALVALVGPNGAGKSTVLDNLHPYRLQPSRAGGYSPGSFSYYDQVTGPEAGKELTWEHDGRVYRSALAFKVTGKTKKTDAYLFVQAGSEWIPATAPDGTVSDGKADTYDRLVESVLGSPEMFFTSAFSCQGRRSLSSYANGEIKGLLSELLGLDHLRALGDKAKAVGAGLRMRADGLRGDLARADELETGLTQASTDLDAATQALPVATQARNDARAASAAATRKLADMQAEARGNTEIEIRRGDLGRRIAAATTRADAEKTRAEADKRAAGIGRDAAATGLNTDITALYQHISGAQQQIGQSRAIHGRATEVEKAKLVAAELAAAVTTTNEAMESARANHQAALSLALQIRADDTTLAGIIREGKQLAENLSSLKTRSNLVDTVPCAGTDISGQCLLLKDAHAAKAETAPAEAARGAKLDDYNREHAAQQAMKQRLAAMGDTEAAQKAAKTNSDRAVQAARSNDALLALAPAIQQAEQVIAAAQANITAWEASIATKREALTKLDADHSEQVAAIQKRLLDALALIDAEVATLRTDLAALPPSADTTALAQAEQVATAAEGAMARAEQELSAVNVRIGGAKERIAMAEKAIAGLAGVKALGAKLEAEIAHWNALAKAFGNDGIVALSIDDAGPTLAAYANDLLLSCYGPRFSVSIRTQAETAKGDLKETFDIVVFDGDQGDEKSVRDMSGGERIYINEALTRAIALYQKQMHGRHYECLFADESDGALDPERKAQFMRMKRKVMELGGYRQEIFISHTPELWEMADAVIDMGKFK